MAGPFPGGASESVVGHGLASGSRAWAKGAHRPLGTWAAASPEASFRDGIDQGHGKQLLELFVLGLFEDLRG